MKGQIKKERRLGLLSLVKLQLFYLKRFFVRQREKKLYKSQISDLRILLAYFDPVDLNMAVYAISSWNNNRNASGRLRFLYQAMLSIPLSDFGAKKIQSSDDLSVFFNQMLGPLPDFGHLEEHIPGDWGHIKFYHEKSFYNFLYGSDICWAYDQAHNFLTIARSMKERCVEVIGRNPVDEFEILLGIMDATISQTKSNIFTDADVKIGHLEVPSTEYWEESKEYLQHATDFYLDDFKHIFSKTFGDIEIKTVLDHSQFSAILYDGRELDFMFTDTTNKIFPLPPRWLLSSFIQHWARLITHNLDKLKSSPTPTQIRIGMEASRFVKARLPEGEVIECVSSSPPNGSPDIYIFPIMFCYQNKIVLCSFLKPFTSQDALDHQLKEVQDGIEATKANFQSEITFILNLRKQGMKYNHSEEIQIDYLAILPNISPCPIFMTIPREFPAKIFTLEQLLGVVDSCRNVHELVEFLDFDRNDQLGLPTTSLLDKFAAFKDSSGILVEGAIEPTQIFIDVNWGDYFRFSRLKEFWGKYPPIPWNGNPSSWSIDPDSDEVIRIANKTVTAFELIAKIGETWILANSPTDSDDRETTFFIDALVQCLQDYFQRCCEVLQKHAFFNSAFDLRIFLFSKSQFYTNKNLGHLEHLTTGSVPWNVESGRVDIGLMGLRVCIDDELAKDLLTGKEDSHSEVMFVKSVLEAIDRIKPGGNSLRKVFAALDELASGKPSYTVRHLNKPGSTPTDYTILKPSTMHLKIVRKHIANLAKEVGIEPGRYSGGEAKQIIDTLLDKVETVIGDEIRKHNFVRLLHLAVTNIESLILDSSIKEANFESVPQRQVSYHHIGHEAERVEEYKRSYKHHRYLIERTVLESATGPNQPNSSDLKLLLAYVNWFFVFADSGDNIHHGLYEIEIEINSDYLVDNHFPSKVIEMQEAFGKHLEAKQLGEIGTPTDSLEHPRDIKQYIDDVDRAFLGDFGFGIKDIGSVSDILSHWGYHSHDGEAFFYQVPKERILEVSSKLVEGISTAERISLALDFLTMEESSILKLIGNVQPASRIPIWEYYKRHTRYTIRPLIKIENELFWGPGSVSNAARIWTEGVIKNKLPINPESPKIVSILDSEKTLIENSLETKAFEITKRYTEIAEPNVKLHKRNKEAGHPQDEYDVLAYFPNENILLSIEAKHLHNVYCLKDARSLKEGLFGKTSLEKSYVGKALRRHAYLIKNWRKVASTMNWPITEPPEVESIFVSKFFYWWTYMPPVDVPISFTVIDELDDTIRGI